MQAASPQPVYDALADGRADVQRSDAAEPPFDPLEFDAGFDASLADPTEAEPWPTPNPRYPNCLAGIMGGSPWQRKLCCACLRCYL